MLVAILVICYVLVLRYLDKKNRERDRLKAGIAAPVRPDYASIKRALAELSQRVARLETEHLELLERAGGVR